MAVKTSKKSKSSSNIPTNQKHQVISLEQYPIVNISINKDNKLLSTIQINLINCKNTSKIFSLNNILDVYDTGIVIDYKNKKIYNYQGISRDLLDK